MWFEDSTIRKVIKETAEECGVTPSIVLGVLVSLFDTMEAGMTTGKVSFYRLRGLGSIRIRGYKFRRKERSDKNKSKLKKEEIDEEEETDDLEDIEEENYSFD